LWEFSLKRDKAGALVADPLAPWEEYVVGTGIPALAGDLTLLSKGRHARPPWGVCVVVMRGLFTEV
jgi:hypothetical protein